MKAFFVLIFISLKLVAFPIVDEKTMFFGKTTTVKEYQDSHHKVFLDQELTETEESEDESTDDVSENSSISPSDCFVFLQKQNNHIIQARSIQSPSSQQLYKLYQRFLI